MLEERLILPDEFNAFAQETFWRKTQPASERKAKLRTAGRIRIKLVAPPGRPGSLDDLVAQPGFTQFAGTRLSLFELIVVSSPVGVKVDHGPASASNANT